MRILGSLQFVSFTRTRVLFIAAFAVATGATSAYAGEINAFDLVLTETSPTSLSLSYNGPSGAGAFNVVPIAPDTWTVQVDPMSFIFLNFIAFDWEEPEDPNNINEVSLDLSKTQLAFVGQSFTVRSDLPLLMDNGGPVIKNGDPAPLFIGSDDEAGEIRLTFIDMAQQAENPTGVPDTGSTLGLFGLSCGAVLGLTRVRALGLA